MPVEKTRATSIIKPLHIIYRPLDSPVLKNITKYVRTINGNVMIPKRGTGKRIRGLLGQNEFIGIMSDQNVSVQEGEVSISSDARPARGEVSPPWPCSRRRRFFQVLWRGRNRENTS
jgi:hypothetical protein